MARSNVTSLRERRSPSAVSAPAADVAGDTVLVPHDRIRPSALNPRKHFDPAELEELAASIEQDGLLQNLVVRPHPTEPGQFELAAGERRWRALALLVERGTKPADLPVRVAVRELTDAQLLVLSLAENIQRANMHPLEEGEAFLSYTTLSKRGDAATAEIATLLGKTQRWVQQRIALVTKLAPEAKDLYQRGVINLEQAKALLTAPVEMQRDIVQRNAVVETPDVDPDDDETLFEDEPDFEELEHGDDEGPSEASEPPAAAGPPANAFRLDADGIRRALTRHLPKCSWALFDLSLYDGEIIGDPDEPLFERCFADVARFQHLQEEAIALKEAELAASHQSVDVVRSDYFRRWEYDPAEPGQPSRAVVHVDQEHHVTILTGQALPRAGDAGSPEKAARKTVQEPCTKALLAEAHRRKTATLQDAIASDPKMALRLACLALLTPGSDAPHLVRLDHAGQEDHAIGPITAKRIAALLEHLPKELRSVSPHETPRPQYGLLRGLGTKIWAHLLTLNAADVEKLHATLVAAQFGTFSGHDPKLGDSDLVVAIATSLKLDHAAAAVLDDDWLSGYRKPRLAAVAVASGAIRDTPARELEQRTGKDLRAAILASKTRSSAFVPDELYFGTAEDLEARSKPKKAAKPAAKRGGKKPSKKR